MKLNHYPYKTKQHIFNISAGRIKSRYEDIFPQDYMNQLQNKSGEADRFVEAAIAGFIAEQPKAECLAYFKQAQQYQHINFYANIHPGENVTFCVKGVDISMICEKRLGLAEIPTWSSAFYLALILREKPTLDLLCEYQSREHADSRAEHLPFDFAFCDFLQGVYNPKSDLQALLNEVVRLSDPEFVPEYRQPYIYWVVMPFINIFLAVLANDEAKYNNAITKALENSYQHYTSTDRKKQLYQGWLPLHIHAGAALAYEQCGFRLSCKSPYIAEWLVYGDFE